MASDKRLFLLDAMALIYRAYFALNRNPRINSKGLNTSAILGFANTLFDLIKREKPTHLGVAFDTMAPTVRHDEYVEYKANRESLPEDIAISLPYIRKLLEAFGVPILEVEGYEADDVIGTLAKRAARQGFITYMVTPDKDFGQLVEDTIHIYKPGKAGEGPVIMGSKEVCEKFGISRPTQVIDILGLWGDASDNIPGVPMVGEKKAKELISRYDTLENVLDHAHEVTGKVGENLVSFRDQALQSKMLATIILDVPIAFDPDALHLNPPDREQLMPLLEELEFRTFARRISEDLQAVTAPLPTAQGQQDLFSELGDSQSYETKKANIESTPHKYHLVNDRVSRDNLVQALKKSGSFCFDTETTGLDPFTSEIIGMSFAMKPGEAWYVVVPEKEQQQVIDEFREVFADEQIEKTGQNLKFDISMLNRYKIEVKGRQFDTMIAHYLLQPEMRHNLDYLAETYLDYTPVSFEELTGGKGKKSLPTRSLDIEKLKEYAGEDADITLQLRQLFEKEMTAAGAASLFYDVEMPLIPVLAAMESEGVKVDMAVLAEYSQQLGKEIYEIENQIYELVGTRFNIGSPKQLGEILFDRLKIIDKPKKTRTQQYSTGEDILSKLVNKHPVIQLILDYRSLTKLKSTYVDSLPLLINPASGRIHTSYNQAVTATGRLSSTNPNMQNIPIRTERGREIRKAFVPRDDQHILLAADYSQIELRIIASLSGDENMVEAFRQGIDIHAATAAGINKVPLESVTRDMRRYAKTVNFGIIYGISAFGLSERLGIPRAEASSIINEYFGQYPGIRSYMQSQIETARRDGYVETILKRRRYLRDINSTNAVVRGFAERNAINAPIQGSSADMIKVAMIRIHDALKKYRMKSRMMLQVHDELVFDAYRTELEDVKQLVRENMIQAIPLLVPVEVDVNTGENWLEAH